MRLVILYKKIKHYNLKLYPFQNNLKSVKMASTDQPHPVIGVLKSKGLYDGPFTVLFSFKVKEGTEDPLIEQIKKNTVLTLQEKGCVAFETQRSVDDPTSFTLYEKWADGESLGLHMAADYTKKFFELLEPIKAEEPVAKFFRTL